MRIWDLNSGSCVRLLTGHKGRISALQIAPDGRLLASAGEFGHVLIWDVASGRLMYELQGHQDTVKTISFSQEGSILATGGLDNTVKLWNTEK